MNSAGEVLSQTSLSPLCKFGQGDWALRQPYSSSLRRGSSGAKFHTGRSTSYSQSMPAGKRPPPWHPCCQDATACVPTHFSRGALVKKACTQNRNEFQDCKSDSDRELHPTPAKMLGNLVGRLLNIDPGAHIPTTRQLKPARNY